jgi:hypothetical protein
LSAIKSEANAPTNQNGLLRNKTKTMFGVPMVLLVIAASGQLGVAKSYMLSQSLNKIGIKEFGADYIITEYESGRES